MALRVLHVLSQRPQRTGSGITLEALIASAKRRGYEQAAVIGIPGSEPAAVAGIAEANVHALRFETPELPFPVPGMSDTMPYPSTRFGHMSVEELERYQHAFRERIASAVKVFRPDIIHTNHLWLATGCANDVAASIPTVAHCHGTGLRQMELCPELAPAVIRGVRRCQHFFALHDFQRAAIVRRMDVAPDQVSTVGAGYRDDVFTPLAPATMQPRPASDVHRIVYAGKLAKAKGVPQLLDAVDRIAERRRVRLTIAGDGAGEDARAVRQLAERSNATYLAGAMDQPRLAELLRSSDVFVLPSFYEGLPLVLVEAFASGCRLVASDLPGVRQLSGALGERLELVPLPRLVGPDEPAPEELPAFTRDLQAALTRALDAPKPPPPTAAMLAALSWDAVFDRIEPVWRRLARR